MVKTPTTNIKLGFKAPDFLLPNVVSNQEQNLETLTGEKGLVVMFICNHCPFVVHVIDSLIKVANAYIPKGVGFVAISSNDIINYPDDSPDKMKDFAQNKKFPFAYLYDETQEVAKAYNAACTPDFSIFDQELRCIYRGQMDGSRPGNNIPNDGKDMRKVLDYLLMDKVIDFKQHPSLGCNIKWK